MLPYLIGLDDADENGADRDQNRVPNVGGNAVSFVRHIVLRSLLRDEPGIDGDRDGENRTNDHFSNQCGNDGAISDRKTENDESDRSNCSDRHRSGNATAIELAKSRQEQGKNSGNGRISWSGCHGKKRVRS